MRTSFVRYVSPKPRHTSARKGRAIVGAAQGGSGSAIPDVELIHPGVSDLDRETPFGNSTGILGVVGAHLLRAETEHAFALVLADLLLTIGSKRNSGTLGPGCRLVAIPTLSIRLPLTAGSSRP